MLASLARCGGMYLADDLNFVRLMALGRRAAGVDEHAARVAVLGFCTTEYYSAVLRGIGAATGFPITTYEPEYNTVHQTLLDPQSPLYSFSPDFVVILTAVQGLRTALLGADAGKHQEVAEHELESLRSVCVRASQIPGVTVVVNEFVVPYERPWGNFSAHLANAPASTVRRINDGLRQIAGELPNVHTVDCDHIASWLGKKAWFDERLWCYSKSFCHPDALPQVAGQAIDIFRAVRGAAVKCIALDLDNVLWGGTIGEDGLEGIRLGELGEGEAYVRFQLWLRELRARGILLAVCSKNDDERAREPFRKHADMVLTEDDIGCFIANWEDKAGNLRRIAAQLNIGADALLFLDDSPFERNLVRELAPEVCVPELPSEPADFVPYLESLNLFEATQFSAEDRKRADFYRAESERESEATRFTSVDQYLESLSMQATFEPFDAMHLPRITQLVQRTNQFNLTTIRHSAEEIRQFADDPAIVSRYVTLADKFGDSGLISVVIARRERDLLDIVTWLMSCRVVARRLEEFVLDRLVELAREVGIHRLRGRYVPTAKNGLVAGHYERLGFRHADEQDGGSTTWELSVADHVPSGAPIERGTLELGSPGDLGQAASHI